MMDYSYLEIYPSQRVARELNEIDPDGRFVEKVIAETQSYIKKMDIENIKYLELREKDKKIDYETTYKFLRSQERIHNTQLILQYLCAFLKKLPLEEDIKGKPVNPFQQIKLFSIQNIDLLEEKDVIEAILREHESRGLLSETNKWYYRGQIDKSHKMFRAAIEECNSATIKEYRKIFMTLQRLNTFWFSVRNEEIKRVRKSDLLCYQLTRYLLKKYK